jgi:hypothetical protein
VTVAPGLESIALVRFAGKKKPEGRVERLPWDILVGRLLKHAIRDEKDGPAFSPTIYHEGPIYRDAENVRALTLVVLDIDDGTPLDDLRGRIAAFDWVAYTTHSHTTEHPRYRLVFRLSRPVPVEQWREVWRGAAELLAPGHVDQSCKGAERLYFYPSCPEERKGEAWAIRNIGAALDPGHLAAAAPPEPERVSSRNGGAPLTGTGDYRTLDVVQWFGGHAAYGKPVGGGRHAVSCPWMDQHTKSTPATDSDAVVWEATPGRWPSFYCSHNSCVGRGIRDVLATWGDADRYCSQPFRPQVAAVNGCACGEEGPFVASGASVAVDSREPEPPQTLEPEALYGLPGEVVAAIEPHTESHPAAVLASFLTGVGCLIGPGPHVYRDGARHTCNEFACLVGTTASGRKGTASKRTDELFLYTDNNNTTKFAHMHEEVTSLWYDRIVGGLGSGEALVRAIAEYDELIDRDRDDRRRLVFEEEFSKTLKAMKRDNSNLSENLRAAWDGSTLRSRTKGEKLQGRGHISILGHITVNELTEQMGSTQVFNGFANRFLWFATQRVKLLPFGGGQAPLAPVVSALHSVLNFIPNLNQLEFDDEVKQLWGEPGNLYELLTERPPGLLGSVTARAEAHVTRLSLLYAVLDAATAIRVPHLLAALAIWDYNEKTCAYIFGTSFGDDYADQLWEMLCEVYPGGLTRTEIRDKFRRHAEAGRIPKGLALLNRLGKAEMVKVDTEGRAAEYWRALVQIPRDRSDISDESPLQRARRLLNRPATEATEAT